jgi:hypothetical protein
VESYAILLSRPEIRKKLLMRIVNPVFVVTALFSPIAFCAAQQPPAAGASQAPRAVDTSSMMPAAPGTPAVPTPSASSILQPSLDSVQQTLTAVKVERWKRGSVRDEASGDINSLTTDLQQRMPGLLKEADAAPGSLSKTLPVSRHVDALYDVLLRVVEASRIAAPDDQANQLRQALSGLEKARLTLDDSMEQSASSQEKQLVDLRVAVQKQAAFKCPAPPPAPECPKPPVKKPLRKKPAATPAASTGQGSAQKPTTPAVNPQKPPATPPKTGP